MSSGAPRTLYDKLWDSHLVHEAPGESSVIYIDRHLVHEVTSVCAKPDAKPVAQNWR